MAREKSAVQAMFFLSGVGALVLENVWFGEVRLVVGNSVWSAALTVGAFMAGLGIGNGAAAALAGRWRNLVRAYGVVELVAALSGVAVVLGLPLLPQALRPLFAPLIDDIPALNALRAGVAFLAMVLPASALGATLPLLARPLEALAGNYAYALGRLYGVNTLGAVAGALFAELVLVPLVGLRLSGLFAAGCSLSAAALAFRLARQPAFAELARPAAGAPARLGTMPVRILAAAALAGGVLLALEVIWFRFLILFVTGTTLIFAVMLAVVLAGIGVGALAAARWAERGWSPEHAARLGAAGGAIAVVACYAGFDAVRTPLASLQTGSIFAPAALAIALMAPASLLSGLVFTALGAQLRSAVPDAAASTGVLTLANTVGAMAGSFLAAFAMLPGLGVERSFFWLAAAYGALALLVPTAGAWPRRLAPLAAALVALALFPFGTMTDTHYRRVAERFDARLLAAREGIVETAFYLEHDFLGEPHFYRLATNAYSMSSTALLAQRYMKLFVYLPAALHPKIERALLLCFGVGATASALTDLREAKAIDVVDVSRDILEMSDLVYRDPARHPLRDPRVTTRVEDARFFLQETDRRYDLITAEPPPPKIAGVVSLYTREYFERVRERLNPGGIASYWLPMHELRGLDGLAIVRAFCDAFDDCSLWSGSGLDWILLGSRGGLAPVSRAHFERLWQDPRIAPELRRLAVPTPAAVVGLFMADAAVLRKLTERVPPLVDDYPQRVSPELPSHELEPVYVWLLNAQHGRRRLLTGAWAKLLPPELVAASATAFRERGMLDAMFVPGLRPAPEQGPWPDIAELLRGTDFVELPRLLLGSDATMAEIAARHPAGPLAAEQREVDALVHRRAPAPLAREGFAELTPPGKAVAIFARCLAGQASQAKLLASWIGDERPRAEPLRSLLAWYGAHCTKDALP
jgi:spermidine synthase